MGAGRSISCDRTRALVSSGLDTRLHDLERRFLDAHLRRCSECRSFAGSTEWFTNIIRTTPLEPAPPVALPRRRRRVQLRSVASVASAAAVLVVAGSVALKTPARHDSEDVLGATALTRSPLTGESIRQLLRDGLASGRLTIVSERRAPTLGDVKPVLPPTG
jgi:hypothetical protein